MTDEQYISTCVNPDGDPISGDDFKESKEIVMIATQYENKRSGCLVIECFTYDGIMSYLQSYNHDYKTAITRRQLSYDAFVKIYDFIRTHHFNTIVCQIMNNGKIKVFPTDRVKLLSINDENKCNLLRNITVFRPNDVSLLTPNPNFELTEVLIPEQIRRKKLEDKAEADRILVVELAEAEAREDARVQEQNQELAAAREVQVRHLIDLFETDELFKILILQEEEELYNSFLKSILDGHNLLQYIVDIYEVPIEVRDVSGRQALASLQHSLVELAAMELNDKQYEMYYNGKKIVHIELEIQERPNLEQLNDIVKRIETIRPMILIEDLEQFHFLENVEIDEFETDFKAREKYDDIIVIGEMIVSPQFTDLCKEFYLNYEGEAKETFEKIREEKEDDKLTFNTLKLFSIVKIVIRNLYNDLPIFSIMNERISIIDDGRTLINIARMNQIDFRGMILENRFWEYKRIRFIYSRIRQLDILSELINISTELEEAHTNVDFIYYIWNDIAFDYGYGGDIPTVDDLNRVKNDWTAVWRTGRTGLMRRVSDFIYQLDDKLRRYRLFYESNVVKSPSPLEHNRDIIYIYHYLKTFEENEYKLFDSITKFCNKIDSRIRVAEERWNRQREEGLPENIQFIITKLLVR